MKKGAMFGLDARIALAIFGALSVISGAALYSAIQQSKIVSIVTELNEVSKAIESFMLDVGSDMKLNGFSNFYIGDLVDNANSINGWKGPYFPKIGALGGGVSGREYLDHPGYGNILLRDLDSNLGGVNYSNPNNCSAAPCYYWIQLTSVDPSITKAIDEYVDGSASLDSGKIRVLNVDDYKVVYFQGPLMLNQP
ncbi:MAG TPA: hypothetical protein DCL21_04375 [Alphaproteobacteria bacterium]|nr:hypothetical protein [Alphaproteobacteria bacterium]